MTSNIDRLAQLLAPATVTTVEYRGRKYAVTQGTGERGYGAEGGGSAAFAYAASELRADTLRADGWDYSHWCSSTGPAPVEDAGLARVLARRHGLRLTRGGSCSPVLSDADFARVARG